MSEEYIREPSWQAQYMALFSWNYPIAATILFAISAVRRYTDPYLLPIWESFRKYVLSSTWMSPFLIGFCVALNFLIVIFKSNGLNQIAVLAHLLKTLLADHDFGNGWTLYGIL